MEGNHPNRPPAVANPLESMLEKAVQIVTSDGRIFVGKNSIIFPDLTYKNIDLIFQ